MGDFDAKAKEYMSRNDRFADAFNFYLYGGKHVIKPEALRELDTSGIVIPYTQENNKAGSSKENPVQKYRDVFKSWKVMSDGRAIYALLGTELQKTVHYAMPVRNLLYDAINYSDQVKLAGQKSRKAPGDKSKGISSAEFLSGFKKSDRLMPVITLTIFFGPDEWDGPKTLHEMFGDEYGEFAEYLPEYRLNLLEPAGINPEDFKKFGSELGEVLEYIKYSKDEQKLESAISANEKYRSVDRDTASLIKEATGSELELKEEEGKVDMCQAIKDMKEHSKMDGVREGKIAGRIEGKIEGKIEELIFLVKEGDISVVRAAARLEITPEEFTEKYLKKSE